VANEASRTEVATALDVINRAWRERRPADLVSLFHPDMTMVLPRFSGRVAGRDANVAGFDDFCSNATVHEYRESGQQIDVVGDTAVATFTYEMVYERDGKRSRATGRDLWVFARDGERWLAMWGTMLDLAEQPA
jgi:ketosteroid isomerase-like protein